MNRVTDALNLRRLGWSVVPGSKGAKTPRGAWKRWQEELPPERWIRESFGQGDEPNIFVITGSISRLCVLDCDDEVAKEFWINRLGEALESTTQVPTSRGTHYYFRLPPGKVVRSRASDGGPTGKWDLQAEGKGVVAPPSIHESGRVYRWADKLGPEALQNAPDALFDELPGGGDGQDAPRSILAHLLAQAPQQEGEGRNNWLARVAGHYAKHIPHFDAYEVLVRQAADQFESPLPEEEIAKLIPSIWSKEQEKKGKSVPLVSAAGEGDSDDSWRQNVDQPALETGWLASAGNRILVQTYNREKQQLELEEWLNADLHVLGIIDTENGRVYEVEMIRATGERREDALSAQTASDSRRLGTWLASHGVSIAIPDTMQPKMVTGTSRIVRYLEAQGAPALEAVPSLGWHEGSKAFIAHEGIITENGLGRHEAVRPDPEVKKWANYRYGFVEEDEARGVLKEVLRFHHSRVAAVFGAWAIAAVLKPQITNYTSQFPFMALEAPSESGKTTGFFPMMMELTGYAGGQTNQTRAALRDTLTSHSSGIAWMDDLDDLDSHGELLRQVTVGGSLIKKGEGNHEQVVATMRAALVVSGEGLGLEGQKALLDRCILLDVPSPTDRRNASGALQWDDILDLRLRYPDLTDVAGTIVQLALQQQTLAATVKEYRRGRGRFADKIAVVRLGARLLHQVAGEGTEWVLDEVDRWAEDVRDLGNENVLTLKVIPEALAQTGWRTTPLPADDTRRSPATPVVVKEGQVWFSPKLLEAWWRRYHPNGVSSRTHTEEQLIQQAHSLGLGGEGGRKPIRVGGHPMKYWSCGTFSQTVIQRSQGWDDGEDNGENEREATLVDGS